MGSGPLSDCTVIELAGLGPAPFATMLLADLGATVIRIDRPSGTGYFDGKEESDFLNRGKRSVVLDLKEKRSREVVLKLVEDADILVEGFRPGVTERLGLGPDDCLARNPALVYGRMTGWGQDGPAAHLAGHDINYISVTGALEAIGPSDGPPQVPLNLVGDFGGGGMYLVAGLLAALHHARRSGQGQVVDAAIVDGVSHLLTAVHSQMATGAWTDRRAANMIDGGAPYYGVYETSDGRHMAVGAIEPQFYAELARLLGVTLAPELQHDKESWPSTRDIISRAFRRHDFAHWTGVFSDSDACVSPVLSLTEAATHPQVLARRALEQRDGSIQAGTAPKFSVTPTSPGAPPCPPGTHTDEILWDAGADVASHS